MKKQFVLYLSSIFIWGHALGNDNGRPGLILASGECKDEQTWCASMQDYCEDHEVIVPMCQKTCGVCGKEPPVVRPTSGSAGKESRCGLLKCQHKCENNVCRCRQGYKLQPDERTCKDIDECRTGNPCNQTSRCINTEGSYECEAQCGKGQVRYFERKECCHLTEGRCGRNSANGGFGAFGGDAIVTRWPWMSLITIERTKIKCGGILIDRKWVMASAHCFKGARPTDVHAYFGIVSTKKNSGIKDFSQGRRVNRIRIHPDYDYPANDVALIRLTRDVTMSDYVNIACLPHNEYPPNGQRCYATGYAESINRGDITSWLQQEPVEIANREKCRKPELKTRLQDDMLCIKHNHESVPEECQGSSGGPLVCQRCSSCEWYVAGLASVGKNCRDRKSFSGFTSASIHESWVRRTIDAPIISSRQGAACQLPGKGIKQTAKWNAWGKWTKCSVTCGSGTISRKRTCINGDVGEGDCVGNQQESRKCLNKPCPGWSDFGDWSDCSKSCGGGTRDRIRTCNGGKVGSPGCRGSERDTKECNKQPCPQWGRWSKWTKCSVTCGRGRQSSQRTCENGKIGDQGCIGKNTKNKQCRRPKCPTWSKWSEWSDCSTTCGDGVQTAKRQCTAGKKASKKCEGNSTTSQLCNLKDCEGSGCSTWTTWTDCSKSCDGGIQERSRKCTTNSATMEEQTCNKKKCPVFWTEWSEWSNCSKPCGIGESIRTRTCEGDRPGQPGCRGLHKNSRRCNLGDCKPVPKWSEWGSWGRCDAACGKGFRVRERECSGKSCPGRPYEDEVCFVECQAREVCTEYTDVIPYCAMSAPWCTIQPEFMAGRCDKTCCLQDYKYAFSEWSPWSECTKSCNTGYMTRKRRCTFPSMCARFNAPLEETKRCNEHSCFLRLLNPDQETKCSASCGGGIRHYRVACDGIECIGMKLGLQPCNTFPCEGKLSSWENWTPCSKTCGIGSKKRERKCIGPPSFCDAEQLEQFEECAVAECNGTWSQWQPWGLCSVNCGIGAIKRFRACVSGNCVGSDVEEEACVTFDCPKVTYGCKDESSMQYLCPLLTNYCDNSYTQYACRKSCNLCDE